MIADSADIHFECTQCGQHLLADCTGAGVTGNCPTCEAAVTVPLTGALLASGHESAAEAGVDRRRLKQPRPEFVERRGGGHGEIGREVAEAMSEAARFEKLFKKAVAEFERVAASNTHAQAELKSFQSDRQQLRNELAQSRQRQGGLEHDLETARAEAAELREQLGNELATARECIAATDTQLAARERELAAARSQADEILLALAATQTELNELRAERVQLYVRLETARGELARATEWEAEFTAQKSALTEAESRVQSARAECVVLAGERTTFQKEAEALRRDLASTKKGRELIDLRQRLRAAESERTSIANALSQRETERESALQTERALRDELAEIRRLREDAERRAAAGAESKLHQDNAVLRGIIARQNVVLESEKVELLRLRRAHLAIRILSLVAGMAAIGLIAFAIRAFAPAALLKDLGLF